MADKLLTAWLIQSAGAGEGAEPESKKTRPLYEVPYYFDAREFLRLVRKQLCNDRWP